MIARRQKLALETGDRRARRLVVALGATFVLGGAALLGPASSISSHVPESCTTNQQQGKLCLRVSDTPDPVSYSAFDGNITFIRYVAEVTNASRSSSLSHVVLRETLPEGTSAVRVTTSRGTCSTSEGSVDCAFGTLKKGEGATVEVVVTAPATSASDPPDLTITNAAEAAFDERFSDQPSGRQDTVTYSETTTVSKTAGQTFVPKGHSGRVDTDPAQLQYANASIRNASKDVVATIEVLTPDAFCPLGQVTVNGRVYVCRAGGFVDVSVVDADTGETYTSTQEPLVFHLRWDEPLTFPRQNARNMVAFYQLGDGAPTEVFDARCNTAASNTPCLRNIVEEADGGWSFDLVKPDNGRMR